MIRSTGNLNIKVGDLKHKITIQQYINTTDDDGYKVQKWVDIKNPWAKVENLYGREYFAAAAVQEERTVKFTIRYTKNLDETMRIKFGKKTVYIRDKSGNVISSKEVDRVYDIKFIDNIKYANRFIEIQALEGKS
jgi:SPP1 family predicted phage head-tail adaptor